MSPLRRSSYRPTSRGLKSSCDEPQCKKPAFERSPEVKASLHRTRLVAARESYSLGERGMAIQPKLNKGARVRIGQVDLAKHLKSFGRRRRSIRYDPVSNVQTVDIRLVLLIAAERVGHRLREKDKDRKEKH